MTTKPLLIAVALTLSAFTASAAALTAKAERTEYHTASGKVVTNAVSLTWRVYAIEQPIVSYEVERRLFPFGWRRVGQSRDLSWIDAKPSRRESWYRVRAVLDKGKSPWSPRTLAPAVP